MSSSSPALNAAIAAHRFGLGEASLDVVQPDAAAWLLAQIGPADTAVGDGLLSTRQALALVVAERETRQRARNPLPGQTAEQVLAGHYRPTLLADARSHLLTAAATERPFAERLQLFWANHFTVSLSKGATRGLIGAFERDAIRPNIAGPFEALLLASTTHPAMLRYLDNALSAGPNSQRVSRAARRAARQPDEMRAPRITGLNENLAREVLELHTLGAEAARSGVYTQADVTAFAAVLTGWRVDLQDAESGDTSDTGDTLPLFNDAWHEPGRKTVLGKSYPAGAEALRMVLHDLALHPATARFVATKLARHFVADDPPPALVSRLTATYLRSNGELAPVYRELVRSPEAWNPQPAKLKTPEEFVLSALRVLRPGEPFYERGDTVKQFYERGDTAKQFHERGDTASALGITTLGQRIHAAPSPAGWSDRAADWLGPDAVWKRVEWATRTAARMGPSTDARALAARSLGPLLSAATQAQIERAADGTQALALLLMAPEFQRR